MVFRIYPNHTDIVVEFIMTVTLLDMRMTLPNNEKSNALY